MLIGGAFALLLMSTFGGALVDYGWQEAQREEIRAALRAAVSSAGRDLAGAGGAATNQRIADRVESFVEGLLSGLNLDDVQVAHDLATGITTITARGRYRTRGLWREDREMNINESISTVFSADRYETAVALDMSNSMTQLFGASRTRKIEGLRAAMGHIATVMDEQTQRIPGSMMVSIVPFVGAVNVADTGGTGRTAGKERYVRMLAGGAPRTGTTLRNARGQSRDGRGGHWVDSFHHYGVGENMGPLQRRFLPAGLLRNRSPDWNLRRRDVDIDVSTQVPALGNWVVDDIDTWNGCVMARWGAYWHPDARGPMWDALDSGNWPASQSVPTWSAGATALPEDTPLHLSDAPPEADDPNTLFTAYSWPDARISGTADARLQTVMAELLDDAGTAQMADLRSDNDWSLSDGGGDGMCPDVPITPLTDNLMALNDAVSALDPIGTDPGYVGLTYLHSGIVWGLRTLSPLWRDVWHVRDVQNAPRPSVSCPIGRSGADCNSLLRKTILIVSDGEAGGGTARWGPVRPLRTGPRNPLHYDSTVCQYPARGTIINYNNAHEETTASAFDSHFTAMLNASGQFTGTAITTIRQAFMDFGDTLSDSPARRSLMELSLAGENPTPWGMFRNLDGAFVDFLVDPANQFGFDGRPIHANRDLCDWVTPFGPYGRLGDLVYVDDSPVVGMAPFPNDITPNPSFNNYIRAMTGRLNDWFEESCRIAWERGVRVRAVFIGDESRTRDIAALERCVDAAGGNPDVDDVFVTPDQNALETAFRSIFTVRRSLRFID